MSNLQKYILVAGMLSGFASQGFADEVKEIYKWKDGSGVVRYTDMPPPNGTPGVIKIKRKSSAVSVGKGTMDSAGNVKESASSDATAKKQKELAEMQKNNQAVKEEQDKVKKLNCAAAKANYQTYKQGGRVFKTNANGEREYMDDKGLENGAADAQKLIEENCN
jgi:hypothetical protein